MYPKLKPVAAALAVLSVCPVAALAADGDLEPIVVTASGITQREAEATYASEIHTRKMIEKTTAATLFDYLSQYSSVNVQPSYGNTATPLLDMRGFGTGGGYQNIVISVDGRRLNNVDLSSPLLASIPLASIERIEIAKGSSSVTQGDGATAGSIQIFTRPQNGVTISTVMGNYGFTQNSLNAGLANKQFDIQILADTNSLDGYRHADATGHKDSSMLGTQKIAGNLNVTEDLRLSAEAGHTDVNTRYGGSITQAQFDTNPAQVRSSTQRFTYQKFNSDYWRVGAKYTISPELTLTASTSGENKRSEYVNSSLKDYNQTQHNLDLRYAKGALELLGGIQSYRGAITQSGSETSKENLGIYLQGKYQLSDLTSITAGVRDETVTYKSQLSGLSMDKRLSAFDIGVNHQFSQAYFGFVNYNQSFLAPDVDRFFSTIYDASFNAIGRQFNGFIDPQLVRTLSTGVNRLTDTSKTKATLFYSKLENEIYYEPVSGKNTNLDRTHKYGLELQHFWKATDKLSANLNYSYTRSIIDEEQAQSGAYAGKELPGVPKHSVLASVMYAITPKTDLMASQMWRDKAYSANDFTNSLTQQQGITASTNLAVRHRIDKQFEVFASVDNLFAHKNGIWIRNDSIYPVSFTPNYKIGLKANF